MTSCCQKEAFNDRYPYAREAVAKLRLTRVASKWHTQEKQALAEGWTPSRYLLLLCSEEATHRESERLRRYIKDARLPTGKSVSEYNFGQVPELNAAQIRQLCETMAVAAADRLIHHGYIFE